MGRKLDPDQARPSVDRPVLEGAGQARRTRRSSRPHPRSPPRRDRAPVDRGRPVEEHRLYSRSISLGGSRRSPSVLEVTLLPPTVRAGRECPRTGFLATLAVV